MIDARSLRPPHSVPSALSRVRPLISSALSAGISRLSPELQRIAAYHLGWQDGDGRAVAGDGGKAVRPAITLLAAEAVGGRPEDAIAGAVALELVHNFSLIHDDVMDGDRERRHRPTVWALFGVGEAIVAGDAIHSLALELLLEDGRPESRRAALELSRATGEMIRGQSEDIAFESRVDVTETECLEMSSHKTAALLACAGVVGSVLGGGDDLQIEAVRMYGRHLGIAFQAVDDVLGIWGETAVTGKPAASDLRQHKKTFPVVHALAAGNRASQELSAALANGELSGERLREVVSLLDEVGARRWTLDLAERSLLLALEALDGAALQQGAARELREVALFVARREF